VTPDRARAQTNCRGQLRSSTSVAARSSLARPAVWSTLAGVCLALSMWTSAASAQGGNTDRSLPKAAAEQGVRWQDLKSPQQTTLKPLERDWSRMDAPQKQKWVELSTRFPNLTPAEKTRVQERMSEWTRLTPQERGQARLNFQEAKQLPAQDRQERWNAYQALTPEQKQQLAERASASQQRSAVAAEAARRPVPPPPGARDDKAARELPQTKLNIVPNPALSAGPKSIGPTVVQARPGATTSPINTRPVPPSHQQTGLPKIAATPEFVNKATLLPRRGPQGAATRSATAPGEERPARQ
jgi:hypothetical protein